MEELLHVIADELSAILFLADKRDSGSWQNTWSHVRPYKDIIGDLRSAMYDELNEPYGIRKLLNIFRRKK
jgi:hypothetical protein